MDIEEKQQIIIIKYKNIKLFYKDINDKEYLTSGKFISNIEYLIDSFVIMKKRWYLKKFYFKEGFSSNISIALFKSGYLINELAIPLLEHFEKRTSKSTAGRWRLLIWDEYNSHIDYEVRDWCWKHHIVPFTLSPHATHLLQPLDVVCFQPYKYYHC